MLINGADLLVNSATSIAKKINLSEILIGILIVGIGTSLPEIIVTIRSSLMEKSDIVIGNGIGSSICNILLVVGIAAICKPVEIDEKIIKVHFPISIFGTILLLIFCNFGDKNKITRIEAFALIAFTILYIVFTIYEAKKELKQNKNLNTNNVNKNIENNKKDSALKIITFFILGIIFLKFGADFVVDGAVNIAKRLKISESIIGMTIIAIGTTLPEIITSLIASINKKDNLAIGSVIGSNIFNICLLPGIGSIIKPIDYDSFFNTSLIFLALIIIEIIIIQKLEKKYIIERKMGLALSFIYVLYTFRLVLNLI